MHPSEIENALDRMVIIVDTREHPTDEAKRRWTSMGLWDRRKLDFGDYSAFTLVNEEEISLENICVVERKMNLDELAMCFTSERDRFEREFERAKAAGCRIVLLVENASWEALYRHRYRSKLNPSALAAGILAWSARYDMVPVFCDSSVSGKLIHDILRYNMREVLKDGK